jgi:hypothetical protein
VLWALDSGFEHIEIDEKKLLEGDVCLCITSGLSITLTFRLKSILLQGWQNREKDGLPRLMEALQSNKWSTMVVKRQGMHVAKISSEQNTCIYVLCDSKQIARWHIADQEQVQETTKLMDVGVKATSNDPDNLAVKKSIDKSLLDLDLDAEVSDELDEELYGQFADVISKVCADHEYAS